MAKITKPKKVNRDKIKDSVQNFLWAKAAGRCQFAGCNKPLWKSEVTQESVNVAEKAHIYAVSEGGARGNKGISKKELNEIGNLMLVCHGCHKKIDKDKDGGRYTVQLLRKWKQGHEARVERVTNIDDDRKSHVVLYGANIGDHGSPLTYEAVAGTMFDCERYPVQDRAIKLGRVDSAQRDSDPDFWSNEVADLDRKFDKRIREEMADGSIQHVSLFALAPQPLLVHLGACFTDIAEVDVYQRYREPATWGWQADESELEFTLKQPSSTEHTPVLILSVTATVNEERITSVLGRDVSIWHLGIKEPRHDAIRSKACLARFRTEARKAMDQIKASHGEGAELHVCPAAPNSVAIEFGRIRQPKADMPWIIYDHVSERGGFIPALTIPTTPGATS